MGAWLLDLLRRLAVLAYLMAPVSAADPKPPPPSPAGWAALRDFAARHDLCVGADIGTVWPAECNWVRQHYWECRNAQAPYLADLAGLPTDEVAQARLSFAGDFGHCLEREARVCCWRRPACEFVLEDVAWRYRVYKLMVDARHGGPYLADRRMALAQLRALVGPAAYYGGVWPDPVPLWALQRDD